jgi:hypothetical protein
MVQLIGCVSAWLSWLDLNSDIRKPASIKAMLAVNLLGKCEDFFSK